MSGFSLPDLGEGLSEAEVVSWHVAPGDHVVVGQPLVSVETAKAVVEIPSPRAGRVAAIHGKAGETLKVGDVLVDFAEAADAGSPAIVGTLPEAADAVRPAVKASPALRARARELGVDLAKLAGTGPGGAITSADIEAARPAGAESHLVPLRGARRTMAQNMARAGAEVVPATVTEEADIGHWPPDRDVTVQLILALQAGIVAEPRLNAWYEASSQSLRLHDHINLGLAQDTPEGLFVPALRLDATSDAATLRREIERLKTAVIERRLSPQEMSSQTITLSNFGMIAGLHASLVIVPPQVAIVGAGRIVQRVTLVDGMPRAASVLPLSLTFDHRALSGGEAVRFLKAMITFLEAPPGAPHSGGLSR